jgi:hypothetical protein
LARLLTHEDPWSRGFSAWSLGLLDARDHAPAVASLLADENAWVRVYAVQALGRLDARTHAPALAKRLTDMANCSLLRYEDPDRVEFAPAVVGETAMEVLRAWGWDLAAEAARIAEDLDAPDAESRSSAIDTAWLEPTSRELVHRLEGDEVKADMILKDISLDRLRDRKSLLVRTGYGADVERQQPPGLERAVVVDDIVSAADWIVKDL